MFIPNLTDQFFNNVLGCHKAVNGPITIDNNSHFHLGLLQVLNDKANFCRSMDKNHRLQDGLEVKIRIFEIGRIKITGMDGPDDFTVVVLKNGKTGESFC